MTIVYWIKTKHLTCRVLLFLLLHLLGCHNLPFISHLSITTALIPSSQHVVSHSMPLLLLTLSARNSFLHMISARIIQILFRYNFLQERILVFSPLSNVNKVVLYVLIMSWSYFSILEQHLPESDCDSSSFMSTVLLGRKQGIL